MKISRCYESSEVDDLTQSGMEEDVREGCTGEHKGLGPLLSGEVLGPVTTVWSNFALCLAWLVPSLPMGTDIRPWAPLPKSTSCHISG